MSTNIFNPNDPNVLKYLSNQYDVGSLPALAPTAPSTPKFSAVSPLPPTAPQQSSVPAPSSSLPPIPGVLPQLQGLSDKYTKEANTPTGLIHSDKPTKTIYDSNGKPETVSALSWNPTKGGFWKGLGRVAEGIGNVVGDIVDPAAMSMIPGTQLYRQQEAARGKAGLSSIQALETAAQKQQSESDLQAAQQREANAKGDEAEHKNRVEQTEGTIIRDQNGKPIGWADYSGQMYGIGDKNIPSGVAAVMSADAGKTPTSEFELWHQQNPTGTAADFQKLQSKPISQEEADRRNNVWDPIAKKYGLPTGQFEAGMTTADAQAQAAAFNNIIGKQQGQQRIQIDLGNQSDRRTSQSAKEALAGNKEAQPFLAVVNKNEDAHEYAKQKTGPSDYAILMDFVDATKPSSGFRFTESERKMILGARSMAQDAEGLYTKSTKGRLLTDQQVNQMLSVMDRAAKHANDNLGRIAKSTGLTFDSSQPQKGDTKSVNGINLVYDGIGWAKAAPQDKK